MQKVLVAARQCNQLVAGHRDAYVGGGVLVKAVAQVMQPVGPDPADPDQRVASGTCRARTCGSTDANSADRSSSAVRHASTVAMLPASLPPLVLRARSGTLAHARRRFRYGHTRGGATWSATPYGVISRLQAG